MSRYAVLSRSALDHNHGTFATPDAAYAFARAKSKVAIGVLLVTDEGTRGAREIRAFATNGFLAWPKQCKKCKGTGKGEPHTVWQSYGVVKVTPNCGDCSGLGVRPEGER